MKTLIPLLVFCLVATCNAELRTWTAVNGKKVEAEFVSNEEGIVKLKLKSGKIFEVPANKLSKADQEFLTAKLSSGSLADNIVGKVVTFEIEGDEFPLQFNGDGRMLTGKNEHVKDLGLTYKIEGNEVLVFKEEERDGGISFSSSIPKVGDQVEFGPKGGKMRVKITMIEEAIKFESQLVGKWVAKVADAKALFTFPSIEGQKEWSWYNKDKETFPDGAETKPELEGVNQDELEERESIFYLKGSGTPYTGKYYSLHPSGQKKVEGYYKDGKDHGLMVIWHENGQKSSEGNWQNNKEEGLWVDFDENGKKEVEYNYKDGEFEGITTQWHENGQKKSEVSWEDGDVISDGKFWNSKGERVDSLEEAEKE